MIWITWQALSAWILTSEHGHEVILKLINAVLDVFIVIDAYLVSIFLYIFIVVRVFDFEVKFDGSNKLETGSLIFVEIVDESFEQNLAADEVANLINSDIV